MGQSTSAVNHLWSHFQMHKDKKICLNSWKCFKITSTTSHKLENIIGFILTALFANGNQKCGKNPLHIVDIKICLTGML